MTSIHDADHGSKILELSEALQRARGAYAALNAHCDDLARVVAAGQVGFISMDVRGTCLNANAQFLSEFGLPPDAQPQLAILLERLHHDDRERLTGFIAGALERAEDFELTVRAEWPGEAPQTLLLQGRACCDTLGRVERLLVISRNISAEQLRSHRFLSAISHELRSPLNAILGWNRILSLKRADDAEVAAITPRIEHSAKSQLRMVNDLLDLARVGSGKLRIETRALRIAKVVAAAVDATRPSAASKGVELIAEPGAEIQPIRGDPERLQQVVGSLLSNAIRFTPFGGRIVVQVRAAGGMIELRVADTGEGIPASRLPYVFDRFREWEGAGKQPSGGLGLSLTLAREIVALHGGCISVESAGCGCGATFIVRLPMTAASAPAVADKPRICSLNGISILVVDDELDARTVVAETLRLEGARVTVSNSARAAIQQLQQAGKHFDLLISDIGMPDEDGYSLIRQVRALQTRAPQDASSQSDRRTLAIAVTGYVSDTDAQAALQAGFDVHVPKPLDFSTFVPMVQRLVAAGTPAAPFPSASP